VAPFNVYFLLSCLSRGPKKQLPGAREDLNPALVMTKGTLHDKITKSTSAKQCTAKFHTLRKKKQAIFGLKDYGPQKDRKLAFLVQRPQIGQKKPTASEKPTHFHLFYMSQNQKPALSFYKIFIVHNAILEISKIEQILLKPNPTFRVQLGQHRFDSLNPGYARQILVVAQLDGTHHVELLSLVPLLRAILRLSARIDHHLFATGQRFSVCQERQKETHLQVEHLHGTNVEGQSNERH
jgi:hypothetical protein